MATQRRFREYGNNAVAFNEALVERASERSIIPQPKNQIQTRKAVKAQPRKKTGLVSTLFVILCIFGLFSFIIARYAIICSANKDVNKLKTDITALQAKANDYNVQISEKMDMAEIQKIASEKLKMGFPQANQIVYVDISDADTGTVTEKDTDNNSKNKVSNDDKSNINVLSGIINALQ